MSLGAYNRTAANRKNAQRRYAVAMEIYGTMSALAGAGVEIQAKGNNVGEMQAETNMRYGFDTKAAGGLTAEARLHMWAAIRPDAKMGGTMETSVTPMIGTRAINEGSLQAEKLLLRGDVRIGISLYGAISAGMSGLQTKETEMRFDGIVIPAGGVVVLDSEYFTATLNGENIIDLYDGEWIEITSKLKAMEVHGNSGGELDVRLLYREKYL